MQLLIDHTLKKLKINKSCCDLNNKEISKVAKELKVQDFNIKKYINSINVLNSENDIEDYYLNYSYITAQEEQLKIDSRIDTKTLLNSKEYIIFNYHLAGHGLDYIAKKLKSNKESVRQIILSSKKKLNPEKNFI